MGYRQVVLTLPEQLCILFHNHSNQKPLYSGFVILAKACLSKLIQAHFKSDACEIAAIIFIHTHSCNGNYNLHLHVILAEGAFFPSNQDWKWFQYLSLSQLRLFWQKHLLKLMEIEFPARQYVINLSCA